MTLTTITKTGTGTMEYPKALQASARRDLITQYLDYVRTALSIQGGNTKTRGEVAGSGIKPWRQKGTGRARHGSTRSPQWRGGGVVFGPRTDLNNAKPRMNQQMRKRAFLAILSTLVKDGRVAVVTEEKLTPKELRSAVVEINKENRTVMLVAANRDATVLKGAANLEKSQVFSVNRFGAQQMTGKSIIILDAAALKQLEERYS